jgi:hypothetical protein
LGLRSRRAWLRDTTVWLALGLSLATTMVVLFRTTATAPRTPTTSATTNSSRGASGDARPQKTPSTLVRSHFRAPASKRPASAATKHTTLTTVVGRVVLATATTPHHVTGATTKFAISPAIAVVTEQWAGTLTYPDDVATSYSFKTTGGTVVVQTSLLRDAAGLSSSLQCSGSSVLNTPHTFETTMKAPPGSCTYNLQFIENALESGARTAYRITAQYPAAVPAS